LLLLKCLADTVYCAGLSLVNAWNQKKKTKQRIRLVPFVYGHPQTNYRTICVNSWKKRREEHVFIALVGVHSFSVIRPIGPEYVKA
jgi:hypothetical protein